MNVVDQVTAMLREARERRGLTQDQLASRITAQLQLSYPGMKVSRAAVSQWENGKIGSADVKSVAALEQVLGLRAGLVNSGLTGKLFVGPEIVGDPEYSRPPADTPPSQVGAASGVPSHLDGILTSLDEAVRELTAEVRKMNRGGDGSVDEPVEGVEGDA